jgi:hypothetical protein
LQKLFRQGGFGLGAGAFFPFEMKEKHPESGNMKN